MRGQDAPHATRRRPTLSLPTAGNPAMTRFPVAAAFWCANTAAVILGKRCDGIAPLCSGAQGVNWLPYQAKTA